MKVLITGGAGFIGAHISKQLLDSGNEVVIFDDFSTSSKDNLDSRAEVIEGDIKDVKLLSKSLSGVDAVIHMASFISVEESVKNPAKYMDNNVLGTASVLSAMREAGVKKIVISSSATVYGEPKSLPILEDAPLSAANPYAASKIAMEVLCEAFHKTDGFDVTTLRYFNPYGPGENHIPETHAIPNFIKAAMEKKPVPLYWKGEQVRDFIYVEDLAAAHIAVLGLSGYNVFNVGSESGVKIIDILTKLSDIFEYELPIEDLGDRKGDVMANYASSEKLKKATGWEAKTGLEEGLRKSVDYFKSRN
jgi:UDP-glucose 4-epimerase